MNNQKCIKSTSSVWRDGLVFPVKVVLHKHVDLCWDPSTHIKSWVWSLTCQLPQHRAKLGGLPAAYLAPGSMRDPASKEKKQNVIEQGTSHPPLASGNLHTHVHKHAYIHIPGQYVSQVVECFPNVHRTLGLIPHISNQVWCCVLVIPMCGRWRLEDQRFTIIHDYVESLCPAWAT